MSRETTYALLAMLTLGLAACGSTPVAPASTQDQARGSAQPDSTPTPAPAATPTKPAPAATVKTASLPAYLDPRNSISSQRSIYFDLDVFSIRDQDRALLELHGKYLASNPAVAIRVEGNTDEHGSMEYNLALGQKRAESVMRALRIYGVKDAQLEAISWGESKPRSAGHDESSWAQNRRVDLQYPEK